MQKIIQVLVMICFAVQGLSAQQLATDRSYASRLWYDRPAVNWNAALPLGNGHMGAMVFGGITSEHLQLNEQTLWSGAPRNWNNPAAKQYLPLVRNAVLKKNYRQADSLAKMMQGPYTESYLPLADLVLQYSNIYDSSQYIRKLDLDSAISRISFTDGNKQYSRTGFASFPDQVIVQHDTCTMKAAISFTATLSSKLHFKVTRIGQNHIVLKGKCPKHVDPVYLWQIKDEQAIQYDADQNGEGMNFEVHLVINNTNGTISSEGNHITVSNADATTIIISAATSYNGYDHSPGLAGKDPSVKAVKDINAATIKSFTGLLQAHLADYQPIFRRVSLNLGESKHTTLPTDERLKKMDQYADPELIATIAQYGRYLLIAGSRPGGQPVNLKGIWNDKVRPEYSSNWCIDHDAQMFYYPVETNNLAEMHEPFLQFIEDLSKNGLATASTNYGMHGWVAHHNTDIWRQTAPVGNYGGGNPHWANWNMSAPWLCAHLFDHYLFTGDKNYLSNKAWPVMKSAALFCLDWLMKDDNAKLASLPSVSPENTFITAEGDTCQVSRNTTADIALMRELFSNCIKAEAVLQNDPAFAGKLKQTISLLPDYKIGLKGQLLEWEEEWSAVDPGHRHLSHLYPVFPGGEISTLRTPQLAAAAKKALSLRAKTNGTWGFSLKAACWARLGEGDSAWNNLQYQLRYVDAQSKSSTNNYGLYPNLFNSEVPATIMNGNACATAAITEMLVQSHTGEIQLLPALPKLFDAGSIKGICARGGFVINLNWKQHILTDAIIVSKLGNHCKIVTGIPVAIFKDGKKIITGKANQVISFKTVAGGRYQVKPV